MPDIRFNCRSCGQHLIVDANGAGLAIKCPTCESDIVIPEPISQQVSEPISAHITTKDCLEQSTEERETVTPVTRGITSPTQSKTKISIARRAIQLAALIVMAIAGVSIWDLYSGRLTRSDLTSGSVTRLVDRVVKDSYISPISYENEISNVLSQRRLNDITSRTVFQQFANGSYGLVDILAIIAKQLDASNTNSASIASILSQRTVSDISTDSAVQQTANGSFRCVELLALIARECDRRNAYSDEIQSVLRQMNLTDISSKSAYQQIANGTYRMAEMLAIACKAADRKDRYGTKIPKVLSQMNISDISSRTAPQQAVNGLFTAASLMALFANLMDRDGVHSAEISKEPSQININDISSETAYQQMANAYYGLIHLAACTARELNP